MGITLANNAHTTLSADASSTDTVLYVEDIDSFPTLGTGDYFYCTIERTSGAMEIVKVTQINASSFIVERGQENTVPISFSIGSRVELRITVQSLEDQFANTVLAYIDDTAFGSSWNGDATHTASRDAVYDKIVDMIAAYNAVVPTHVALADPHTQYALKTGATFTGSVTVPNVAYGSGWNGDNSVPTKNAVYDKLETLGVNNINLMNPAYGAVGDGVTDDSAAMAAALADAISQNKALYIPGGYTFYYNGSGLTGANIRIIGDGLAHSIIVIGTNKYLIDDDAIWGSLHMQSIRTVGGAGVIRSRYTSPMVQLSFTVRDCYFYNYTKACISTNSSDNPHWDIEHNIFWGANTTTCIGIALKGLTDSNLIMHNSFRNNAVSLKLAEGGNNAYVDYNDFIQYEAGTGRVDIHVVPDADGTNAGTGFVVGRANKFGNENSASSDFQIVYADELSGTYFGDRLPDMSTTSTGYIRGHSIAGSYYSDTGTPYQPIVKSMTKYVFGCHYGPITIGGTPPTYVIQFSTTPDALTSSNAYWNLIGPILSDGVDDLTGFAVTNSFNSVKVFDPIGTISPKPAFSATKNGTSQTGIASATQTKVTFTTEDFDQGGYYDSTNSRWTPPAGVVRISACISANNSLTTDTGLINSIYKNGAFLKRSQNTVANTFGNAVVSIVDLANGTDYYEVYVNGTSGGTFDVAGATWNTYFQGEAI